MNCSIIGYADDVVLMSPCIAQLNEMLDICSRFFLKWKIKINVSKSNFIQIGHNDGNHDPICMGGP